MAWIWRKHRITDEKYQTGSLAEAGIYLTCNVQVK